MKSLFIFVIPIIAFAQPSFISSNYAKHLELSNLDSITIGNKRIDLKKLRSNNKNVVVLSQRYVGPNDTINKFTSYGWLDTLHHPMSEPCDFGFGCTDPRNLRNYYRMPYTVYRDHFKTTQSKNEWLKRKEEVRNYYKKLAQK